MSTERLSRNGGIDLTTACGGSKETVLVVGMSGSMHHIVLTKSEALNLVADLTDFIGDRLPGYWETRD